jgi:DNA repair exonuclease SbcCD ATPase subunit
LEEIQKKQDRIDLLQVKINENQEETQRLFTTAQGFQQTVAELKLMKEKVGHTRETMSSLQKDMQEYTESDEELIAMRDSFGRRNIDAQDVLKEKIATRKQLAEELQRVREELGRRTADMGGLEEAKRANERSMARREEVVKEVARRHGFRGMEVIMDDTQIDKIKSLLFQSLKEEKGHLDKVKVTPPILGRH